MSVFLSYSFQDQVNARKLAADLKHNGIEVWQAQDNLIPGDSIIEKTSTAIENSDVVIVLISQNSSKSEWTRSELALAIAGKKHIIPVILEKDVSLPPFLRDSNYLDLSKEQDYANSINKLIAALKSRKEWTKVANKADELVHKLEYIKAQEQLLKKEEQFQTDKRYQVTSKVANFSFGTIIVITLAIAVLLFLDQGAAQSEFRSLLYIVLGAAFGFALAYFLRLKKHSS